MQKFYLTTAISYVNAGPHIGHTLEFIQADALARYHRLIGDDTYFLTGTDEHGVKIYETATKAGREVKDFVDENAKLYENLKSILNLSYDGFVRTSSEVHKLGAAKIWQKMVDAGDIYQGVYKGNYCVGCEAFIPEKDLDEEGNCSIHKRKPDSLEEANYFFKLSKYSSQIRELIESDKLKIVPETRKKEMLNIIGEDGLFDVSFSRPKSALPWGIDVPGDESQVMYVWCDALSNYITAIEYAAESEKFKKLWPADVHLIGKDILRFHAGIWIGMLLSAGLEIPKSIYVHGFVTSEGQKMSKTIGNVVNPVEYVEKYGVDAMRYYLLREIPTTDDGDFSEARFLNVYNSELANSLGNLVNRVVMMVERYLPNGLSVKSEGVAVRAEIERVVAEYRAAFELFDIKVACEKVVALTDFANKYIDDKKPWAMAKEESSELPVVLYDLVELVKTIGVLLLPLVPGAALRILESVGIEEGQVAIDQAFGCFELGHKVNRGPVIFPRIEV